MMLTILVTGVVLFLCAVIGCALLLARSSSQQEDEAEPPRDHNHRSGT